ncbi:Imidazolonepropionase [Fervidobacterium changbaicum]|uniref:Amidohydrolase n=2 Tax=Fervidobacterium TaxID=2422 RepID=A0AAI8CL80_FERIS|nr:MULTISPECIES: amidohydrolase [Fervidobacterium]AMW32465.1 amidohydrolase [Fervidobacterium islandicum]QAV33955.1 amidohydrolase [Fervidobacterium changbaicum]SDH24645.1 Imidazolonepropionase [Fervidobacterium changbaicum]
MKTLIKGGTLVTITSGTFVGDILIENGKIAKIGKSIKLKDKMVEVVDAAGKFVLPGFIDAHSHIGLFEEGIGFVQDGNEMTDPVTPDVRAIDAFNPYDTAIKRALNGGFTTVMIVPGSANVIGGQGAILKFKSHIVDHCIVKSPAGLKMATGENPKRVYGEMKKMPSTRMGIAAVMRNYFMKVQDYMEKKKRALEKDGVFLDRDPKLEIGELVLKGEIPARIHAHRAQDIVTAIRIAKEFGFKLVIEHGTEAYKVADYLVENNVPVVVGPHDFRSKIELKDLTYENVRILNEKGVLTAIMVDHPVIHLEFANVHAALAMKYGAKREDLLKMLTINPAKILGIDDRVGSLEPGKDADIVIWDNDPFLPQARVEKVFIEGQEVKWWGQLPPTEVEGL